MAVVIALACGFSFWYTRQRTDPGIARYNTAMAQAASGDIDGAEQSLLAGIKEDPKYAACYVQLGALYINQKRFADARDVYKRASGLMRNNGQFWFVLGTLDARTGNLSDAVEEAQRSTELLPHDADAWAQYGLDLDHSNKIDAAYAAYRKAHVLQPMNAEYLLTICKFGLVQPFSVDEETYHERELARYLQANPTDLDAATIMAQTEERLPPTPDRLASGMKWANLVLASRPKDVDVQLALAEMYLSANRVSDACRAYRIASVTQPDSAVVLHGLLVCYTRLGQTKQARSITAELQRIASRKDASPHSSPGSAHS